MTTLGAQIREVAYLEGDFVLRSGRRSSYYLDKYRFGTRPDLLRALGEAIAAAVRRHEPAAVRLAAPELGAVPLAAAVAECEPEAARIAAPELGAVPLAAAASLAGGLPFVIVRKEAKEYGTGKRIEGPYDEGDCICLVEDVVTSGGALLDSIEALRDVGLVVHTAVCVVDREEGGSDALARQAVRLRPIFRAGELLAQRNRVVER